MWQQQAVSAMLTPSALAPRLPPKRIRGVSCAWARAPAAVRSPSWPPREFFHCRSLSSPTTYLSGAGSHREHERLLKMPSNRPADPAGEILRARGLRLTEPRRLVLDVVRASQLHPSAYVVYRRVRQKLPHVSLGTVYRNLGLLVAEGFLRERVDASGTRFDPNTAPHDHFTCVRCRRTYDVAPNPGIRVRAPVVSTGFQVFEHRIEFYGYCRACRRRDGRTSSRQRRGRKQQPAIY